MEDSGETRLLSAAQAGSAEALGELARRQAAPVFDFLLAVTGDRTRAGELTVRALTGFGRRVERARTAADVGPLVFQGAWRELDADGWFTTEDGGRGGDGVFPGLSRRRAAIIDLVQRQHLQDAGLAVVIGVSGASARLVRERVMATAAADLGPEGTKLLDAYGSAARAAPPAEITSAVQREAVSEVRPGPRGEERRPPAAAAEAPPARAVLALGAALAGLAALLVVALLAPFSPIALTRDGGSEGRPAAAGGGTPTATPKVVVVTVTMVASTTATRTATAGTATPATGTPTAQTSASAPAQTITPTQRATATATRPPGESPTPASPVPTATPTPTPTSVPPTATPTASPTVCAPRLQVFVPSIGVPPGGQVVRVFNADSCGDAPFVAAATSWLQVQPTSGSIPPFGSVDLQLSVAGDPEPGATATLTVVGPANEITVRATFSR